MYSSAGTRWVALATLALLCLGLAGAQFGDSSSSSSASVSASDNLPCKDNSERISMHGETYKLTECTECTCHNSTISCQFIFCQPVTCREPIKFEGECCKACPYSIIVSDVTPALLGDQSIVEGKASNALAVDLDVEYINNRETTSISGEGLWQTRLWLSSSEDGSSELAGTVVENALTEGQQSQELKKAGPSSTHFRINNIRYNVDMSDLSCNDAMYLCAKFNKGENPVVANRFLRYYFETRPDDNVLTGCTPIDDCISTGATFTDLSWRRELGQVQCGLPTPLTIFAQVLSTANSLQMEGSRLWRMNLFGSRSANGAGVRLAERSQILNGYNQGKTLAGGGATLEFDGVWTKFPMGDLGCGEYQYLCLEFTKGDHPKPNYSFLTTSGQKSVISCLPEQCQSVYVSGVESTLTSADLHEGKNLVLFSTIVRTTEESSPIVGRNMWRLNLYGSENPDGSGPRQGLQEQVLGEYYSSSELSTPGRTLNFQPVHAEYDMTGLDCDKLKYLCTEFSRNPESTEEFELIPLPGEGSLVDCMSIPDGTCQNYVSSFMAMLKQYNAQHS